MSDLKPLGSEKLQGDDKIKRIMEIANYGRSTKTVVTENKTTSNVEYIKESTNGTYGIVREKDSYYVKKGLTESSLDYIGGIFMKNKNRFSSYADALKRLELISGQESLNEAKKYVLKSKSSETSSPVEDLPAEPVASEPSPLPVDDVPMDDVPMDEPSIEPESEENDTKRSDYMAEVQKFSGKLGQSLRDVKERMESDDIKYVINMVLSAVDLDALDEEDKEEIAERFEPKEEEGFAPSDDMGGDVEDVPSEDPDFTSDEEDIDEIMSKLESFIDTPVEEQREESSTLSLDALVKKIALSSKYDEIVDEMTPEDYSDEFEFGDNFITNLLNDYVDHEQYDELYDLFKDEYGDIILSMYGSDEELDYDEEVEEKVDLNQFNDLGIEEEIAEEEDIEEEIDLEELKSDISKLVDETLSKYFK